MAQTDFFSEASKYKQEGNELFAARRPVEALDRYFKSLDFLKKSNISEHTELNVSVNNNISLIYFKLEKFQQCIEFCDNVLNIYSDNTKALLRKGQALLSMNLETNDLKRYRLLSAKSCFVKAKLSLHSDEDISKYSLLISKSIKMVNNKINQLKKLNKQNKQQLYSSYFAPNPAKKINLSELSLFESNINCICSMYVVDYISRKNKDYKSMKFRLAPFDVSYKSCYKQLTDKSIKLHPNDLVDYDEVIDFDNKWRKIAYFHLGSDQSRLKHLYFETSNFKWPEQYTFILWIQWEKGMHLLTTFDSGANAPIYIDHKHIGCASESNPALSALHTNCNNIKNYEINTDDDKWQFVVAMGGDNNTNIYIGDLYDNLPQFIGNVGCDICNKLTWRIGNTSQGPGKVASMLIFDGFLNERELINVYYQSRNEIFVPITSRELRMIRQLMLQFIKLPEMVNIILDYIRYNDF